MIISLKEIIIPHWLWLNYFQDSSLPKCLFTLTFFLVWILHRFLTLAREKRLLSYIQWMSRSRSQVDAFWREKLVFKNIGYLISSRLEGRTLWICKIWLLPFVLFGYSIYPYNEANFPVMIVEHSESRSSCFSSYLLEFSVQILFELLFSIQRLHKALYFKMKSCSYTNCFKNLFVSLQRDFRVSNNFVSSSLTCIDNYTIPL